MAINYSQELNSEQFQVVTQADGPCLVLAGAGSGKTRVLVYRVAYLLEQGISPENILLLTFTNKAAKEMLSRVAALTGMNGRHLWGGTFHSAGNRFLRLYGRQIGLEPNFNILDEDDSKSLIKICLKKFNLPEKNFPKVDLLRRIFSLSVNLNVPIDDLILERFAAISPEHVSLIAAIARNYHEEKRRNNSLDYDDLLARWYDLIVGNEVAQQKISEQFKYILVDEYQDTNFLQDEIIRRLAGVHGNILAVGDDAQSIYSFRGAEVNNILSFPKIFPQSKTFRLEKNYRSTADILTLANYSIANNQNQFKKNLQAIKGTADKPYLFTAGDVYGQADFVVKRIQELQEREGLKLNQIAILFRAHYQSLEMELALNRRGWPYVVHGGIRFFDQAHIKDVTAYLRVRYNFNDGISWRRLLLSLPGIGEAGAEKLAQEIATYGSWEEFLGAAEGIKTASRASVAFSGWIRLLRQLNTLSADDVSGAIRLILDGGYLDYLRDQYENYQERIEDLNQLVIFATNYQSLEKFLADISLAENFKQNKNGNQQEVLTLSTIHQAKGLEWPAVFIIGLAEGQFPSARSYQTRREMEEERRLFYVAVTRAEKYLYLVYPTTIAGGENSQPSTFIEELPDSSYQFWTGTIKRSKFSEDELTYVDEDDVSSQFWARMRARRDN